MEVSSLRAACSRLWKPSASRETSEVRKQMEMSPTRWNVTRNLQALPSNTGKKRYERCRSGRLSSKRRAKRVDFMENLECRMELPRMRQDEKTYCICSADERIRSNCERVTSSSPT
eukprot:TRINITY_DN17314_c0_g1::TRINITY_DN17314_c0_g1_i1::g.7688::m.7688 TRINITY_DN17314_c0_g1::TRINITY_DN17314_c0_g1_i1::g.7688  ORF type:complete len:116 (-),score=-3.70,Deltaretro_Tax/PF05599.6/0.0013 TRINITY_DN17314_c0_g1_i1:145-492(-)